MYLLDTCLFSELTKKDPSPRVKKWVLEKNEQLFFVSVLTFGEIIKGIEKVSDMLKKKKLEQWTQEFLIPRFSARMLPIDDEVATAWGRLSATSEKRGRPLPTIDSLLAATAITYHLQIVTRNTKDFEGLPLTLINPWEATD